MSKVIATRDKKQIVANIKWQLFVAKKAHAKCKLETFLQQDLRITTMCRTLLCPERTKSSRQFKRCFSSHHTSENSEPAFSVR